MTQNAVSTSAPHSTPFHLRLNFLISLCTISSLCLFGKNKGRLDIFKFYCTSVARESELKVRYNSEFDPHPGGRGGVYICLPVSPAANSFFFPSLWFGSRVGMQPPLSSLACGLMNERRPFLSSIKKTHRQAREFPPPRPPSPAPPRRDPSPPHGPPPPPPPSPFSESFTITTSSGTRSLTK